jgi:hypothetical protein
MAELEGSSAVDAFVEVAGATAGLIAAGSVSDEQMAGIYAVSAMVDEALTARFEDSVSKATQRAFETRHGAVEEALGTDLTVESIRGLRSRAELGDKLFADLVSETVKARNGLGVQYDEPSYRRILEESGSVEYVRAEKESWLQLKAERFKAGRQAKPSDLPAEKPKKTAPADEARPDNILADRPAKA